MQKIGGAIGWSKKFKMIVDKYGNYVTKMYVAIV
jgi:hypothetical protein